MGSGRCDVKEREAMDWYPMDKMSPGDGDAMDDESTHSNIERIAYWIHLHTFHRLWNCQCKKEGRLFIVPFGTNICPTCGDTDFEESDRVCRTCKFPEQAEWRWNG